MRTIKTRLVAWCGLVAGTARRVADPKVSTGQAVAELVAGLVLAPLALVAILVTGKGV